MIQITPQMRIVAAVYPNDATAREQKMSSSARRHFHQINSGPVMENLHVWLGRQLEGRLVEPNSSLGVAISYMLKHWTRVMISPTSSDGETAPGSAGRTRVPT